MLIFLIVFFLLSAVCLFFAIKTGKEDPFAWIAAVFVACFVLGIAYSIMEYEKNQRNYKYMPLKCNFINKDADSLSSKTHAKLVNRLSISDKIFYPLVQFYYVTYDYDNFWGRQRKPCSYYIYVKDGQTNKGL